MTATATYGNDLEVLYSLTGNEHLEVTRSLEQVEDILSWTFRDQPEALRETRQAIQYYLDSGAELIGCGTTRICFADGDRVVKIAYTSRGIRSTDEEVESYENFQKDPFAPWIPTAECRYTRLGYSHIKIQSMERLWDFPGFGEQLPHWVNSIDCGQVGYNSKGELVAYDL